VLSNGLAVFACLFLSPQPAFAAYRNWTGSVSTDWSTAGNWSASIPGISDNADFAVAFSNQPSLSADWTVGGLWMTTSSVAQDVTLSSSGGTLTIQGNVINGTAGLGILIDNPNSYTLTITAPIKLGGTQAWRNNSGNLFTVGAGGVDLNGRAFTIDGTGNTTVTGVMSNSGTLTKAGTGTLTLSGANTYTGATTVSAGRLTVTGSLTSAITVASGATLGGKGGTTSSTLTLNAGSTMIGVAQVAGSGNAFRAAGAVTAAASVNIAGSDGNATVGAGHVIDVVGYGTTPGTANFSTANYRSATLADDTTNKKITLTYTNSGRTWNSASSTWDVGTTNAWQEGDFKFFQGDTVTFNDTGTGGGGARTVTLNSLVTPSGVIFNNNTSTYTVSGTGSIGNATGLTKTGTGTVNLATANTFIGNTTVSGGTLAVNADGALGSTAKVTINAGGTVLLGTTGGNNRISDTAEIALAGGTFHTGGFTETVGKMTLSANSTFNFGAGTSRVTFDGASSLGSSGLTVLNWTGVQGSAGGTDQLLFTNSSFTGGTSTNQIQFNISGTLYGANFITINGTTVEAVANLTVVPEPATIFGSSALLLLIGWRERRRFATLLRRV
jgi:autotransporter-associated beta strand protein